MPDTDGANIEDGEDKQSSSAVYGKQIPVEVPPPSKVCNYDVPERPANGISDDCGPTAEITGKDSSNLEKNPSSNCASNECVKKRTPSLSQPGESDDVDVVFEAASDVLADRATLASAETFSISSGTNASLASVQLPSLNPISVSSNSAVQPSEPIVPIRLSDIHPRKRGSSLEGSALRSGVSQTKEQTCLPSGAENTARVRLSVDEVVLHIHMPPEGTCVETTDLEKPLEKLPADDSEQIQDGEVDKPQKRCWKFSSGFGEPSIYHALVVIFLEFFAWGLLTSPMIQVLKCTFPDHTFLMNGIIMGIKGILSFLSAPLIGALSDLWGRKFFLFVTVFFTCLPIPFMKIDTWWYFALISMSGVFAVTYSIVFAYVADVTDEAERHHAYGLVSAMFAASLVISPALGAYLGKVHSDDLVVGLATAIAVLDIFFILVAVPESLPEKLRQTSNWNNQISWEQADPFTGLWKVCKDRNILLISVTVFLSYLPEAGQFSCFFVYLQLVMGFGPELVATFIAVVGVLSVIAQTALLGVLIKNMSNKKVITFGLFFELLQLVWYGFGSQAWMMWAAGILAAVSSITYPAISSYVSTHTDADKQGVVQGIVTGMRGLCAGLGPAMFGFIFYLFQVDLNQETSSNQMPGGADVRNSSLGGNEGGHFSSISRQIPGPPFLFGAMLVLLALCVSAFIPESAGPKNRKQSGGSLEIGYGRGDHKNMDSMDGTSQPLMNEKVVL